MLLQCQNDVITHQHDYYESGSPERQSDPSGRPYFCWKLTVPKVESADTNDGKHQRLNHAAGHDHFHRRLHQHEQTHRKDGQEKDEAATVAYSCGVIGVIEETHQS